MGHSEVILPVEGAYYGCDTAKRSTCPVLEDDRDPNCAQTVPKISSGLSRFLTFDARWQHSHFSNLRKGREIADSSGESGLQAPANECFPLSQSPWNFPRLIFMCSR